VARAIPAKSRRTVVTAGSRAASRPSTTAGRGRRPRARTGAVPAAGSSRPTSGATGGEATPDAPSPNRSSRGVRPPAPETPRANPTTTSSMIPRKARSSPVENSASSGSISGERDGPDGPGSFARVRRSQEPWSVPRSLVRPRSRICSGPPRTPGRPVDPGPRVRETTSSNAGADTSVRRTPSRRDSSPAAAGSWRSRPRGSRTTPCISRLGRVPPPVRGRRRDPPMTCRSGVRSRQLRSPDGRPAPESGPPSRYSASSASSASSRNSWASRRMSRGPSWVMVLIACS